MSYTPSFVPCCPSITAGGTVMLAPRRADPTPEDWERHRSIIKRLYVDENKKLKELAAIMVSQHGHNATIRMYRDRIKKWKLEKKNKESDMFAILRKHTERSAIGKRTSFRVRGQVVTMDQVHQYLKRKRSLRDQEAYDAPTSSDVSCRTPSPISMDITTEKDAQIITAEYFSGLSQPTQIGKTFPPFTSNDVGATEIDGMDSVSTSFFVEDEHILQMTLHDMYTLLSPGSGIPRSPCVPQTILILERLLLTIKMYVAGCFENGTWITGEDGLCTVVPPDARIISTDAPFTLTDYCEIAITFLNRGMLVEFRRIISKAFNLVKDLVRDEHPRGLDSLMDILLYFMRQGCPEIVGLLRKYLSEMAGNLHKREHPWTRIWQLVCMLEQASLEQAFIQSWKCAVDGFKTALGPSHRSSLDANIDFISRVNNNLDAEHLLRKLLSQYKDRSIVETQQILRIMISLGWSLFHQGRYIESEELGLDAFAQAKERVLFASMIVALELIASCQYKENKDALAEGNIRLLIEMVVNEWGVDHPVAIDNMALLETWLWKWGREEECHVLKAKVDEAIGKDDVDEEFDRRQEPFQGVDVNVC
ncbi:uncharacterized protein PAC_14335 [Phialocephala subalpina]|uniref:Clr5 domain-containing protein n=1 Tax=Phialocephala subalpina TaxID=576137 RepID=A0A1L7XHL1_9HELO|nr:uncharacterized protein PAC_14335 [Phialocephala subalpina]